MEISEYIFGIGAKLKSKKERLKSLEQEIETIKSEIANEMHILEGIIREHYSIMKDQEHK